MMNVCEFVAGGKQNASRSAARLSWVSRVWHSSVLTRVVSTSHAVVTLLLLILCFCRPSCGRISTYDDPATATLQIGAVYREGLHQRFLNASLIESAKYAYRYHAVNDCAGELKDDMGEATPSYNGRPLPMAHSIFTDHPDITKGDSRVVRIDVEGTFSVVFKGEKLYMKDELDRAIGTLDDGSTKTERYRYANLQQYWILKDETYRSEDFFDQNMPEHFVTSPERVFNKDLTSAAVLSGIKYKLGLTTFDEMFRGFRPPFFTDPITSGTALVFEIVYTPPSARVQRKIVHIIDKQTSMPVGYEYRWLSPSGEWVTYSPSSYDLARDEKTGIVYPKSADNPFFRLEMVGEPIFNSPDITVPPLEEPHTLMDETVSPPIEIYGTKTRLEARKREQQAQTPSATKRTTGPAITIGVLGSEPAPPSILTAPNVVIETPGNSTSRR